MMLVSALSLIDHKKSVQFGGNVYVKFAIWDGDPILQDIYNNAEDRDCTEVFSVN